MNLHNTGLIADIAIATIIALAVMIFAVLVGRLISKLDELIIKAAAKVSNRDIARFIVNRVMFVGTIFHELSHALLAVLTGAQVTKIRCITLFSKDTLGYVNFVTQGGRIKQSIQKCLIACAPVLTGFLTVPLFTMAAFNQTLSLPVAILCGYIAISILCHMTMSRADLEIYMKGTICTFPIMILIVFVIRFLFFK